MQPGDRAPQHSEAVTTIITEVAARTRQKKWNEATIVDAVILPILVNDFDIYENVET